MKKKDKQKIRKKVDKIINDIAKLDMVAAKEDPKISKVVDVLDGVKDKLEKGLYWNPYMVMVKPVGCEKMGKIRKIKKINESQKKKK